MQKNLKLAVTLVLLLALFSFLIVQISAANFNSDSKSTSEWRMFHRYLNHTSFIDVVGVDISAAEVNKFTTNDNIRSSPAVANGSVYVGSVDNSLYQLNASNVSNLIANFSTGDSIYVTAAVANGYVYVGSNDNSLYQLNASNVSDMIANFSTGDSIRTSPAVFNGSVYVGSEDNNLYQLNSSNVSDMIANFSTGASVEASPAVFKNSVYTGNNNGVVYRLNASNISQEISNSSVGGTLFAPAIANGYVYIPNNDHNLTQLNASNISQKISKFNAGTAVVEDITPPAATYNFVYVGSQGQDSLYQLNASNVSQKLATFTASDSIFGTSPAVTNSYVYIGSDDNNLYQLNSSNISQKFAEYITGGSVRSAPSVIEENVYVGSDNDVYQFNKDLNSPSLSFQDPTPVSGSVLSALTLDVNVTASDENLKNITINLYDSNNLINSKTSTSSPHSVTFSLQSDKQYFFNATTYDDASNINTTDTRNVTVSVKVNESLTSQSGRDEWRMLGRYLNHSSFTSANAPSNISNANRSSFSTGGAVKSGPAVAGDYVYVGSEDNNLYQLNSSNVSEKVAEFSVGDDIVATPAVAGDNVYISSKDNSVYQLNASNVSQKLAEFVTGDSIWRGTSVANGYVYIGSGDNKIYQLNASNVSDKLSEFDTGGWIDSSPAVGNGYVYVGDSAGDVHQLNASNVNKEVASFSTGNQFDTPSAVTSKYVYIGDYNGDLYQLNASNISDKLATYSVSGATYLWGSPAVWNGSVYMPGSDGDVLLQLNASNISDRLAKFDTGSSSFVDSSPSVANGSVFFDDGKGRILQLNASNVSEKIGEHDYGSTYSWSNPAISNGFMYVGAGDANVYQFGVYDPLPPKTTPDTTPPKVSVSVSQSSINSGGSVKISCSVSDSGSGISSKNLKVKDPDGDSISASCGKEFEETEEAGDYTVKLTASDNSGNSASDTESFEVVSSGGSGVSEDDESVSETYVFIDINAGKENSVEVEKKDELGTSSINFSCGSPADRIEISLKRANQSEVLKVTGGEQPPGIIYRYLKVEATGLDICKPDRIEIIYNVVKDWLNRKSISIDAANLYRYEGGWKRLNSSQLRETDRRFEFKAVSNSFSYLAIALKQKQIAEKASLSSCPFECCQGREGYRDKECGEKEVCRNNECVEVKNETGKNATEKEPDKRADREDAVIWWPFAIAALLLVGIYLWYREKNL